MANRCELCRKVGTAKHPVNRHHIRGKKHPEVMFVCRDTCHWFAQWITNSFLQRGIESELNCYKIVYIYNRLTSVIEGDRKVVGW